MVLFPRKAPGLFIGAMGLSLSSLYISLWGQIFLVRVSTHALLLWGGGNRTFFSIYCQRISPALFSALYPRPACSRTFRFALPSPKESKQTNKRKIPHLTLPYLSYSLIPTIGSGAVLCFFLTFFFLWIVGFLGLLLFHRSLGFLFLDADKKKNHQ